MGQQAFQQILSDPKIQLSQSPEEQDAVKRVAEKVV
jgi:hypothetical protein